RQTRRRDRAEVEVSDLQTGSQEHLGEGASMALPGGCPQVGAVRGTAGDLRRIGKADPVPVGWRFIGTDKSVAIVDPEATGCAATPCLTVETEPCDRVARPEGPYPAITLLVPEPHLLPVSPARVRRAAQSDAVDEIVHPPVVQQCID